MPKSAVALLAASLAALALAACGGGGSSTSESTGASAPQPPPAKGGTTKGAKSQAAKKGKSGKSQQQKGSSSGSSHTASVPPLEVSGGGSAKYRTKGGDNSIQNYGEEDESELQEAAEALHGFYVARSQGSWAKACSYLTKTTVKQFEELASRSPQLKGKGCAVTLKALTRPLPPSVERETTLVDAVSLRREGERAFLLYRGGEGKVYAIPMVREGGAWKVGSLAGTPIG